MKKFFTRSGKLTPYAFACGYVEEVGQHVKIYYKDGCYIIRRDPHAPTGWMTAATRTLVEARRIAHRAAR